MTDVILIDLASVFWQMWHATSDLEVNETYKRTVDKVHRLSSRAEHAAVCCDMPPYLRKAILPSYKAQRDTPSTVAVEQLRRVKERLFGDGFPIWEAKGYEADDIIASAVKVARSRNGTVLIASGDKDLMQLVSEDVHLVSVQTNEEYGPDEVAQKWGVSPELLGDVLALVGDKSDNVPGVPGIGPKKAAALIATHGDLNAALSAGAAIGGAVGQALVNHADNARLARRLIELDSSVPVPFDQCLMPRGPLMSIEDEETNEAEFTEEEPEETQPDASEPPRSATATPLPELTVQTKTSGTELAVLPPQKWELALEPPHFKGALLLARYLFQSRLYGQFQNEQAVLAVILRGRALGLDATTSLANFHVIEGKPSMNAALLIGLVIRSGAAEYLEWSESDTKHATWITKRKGNQVQQKLTWTMDDALHADLVRRDPKGPDGYQGMGKPGRLSNWDKYRATMLRWRCGVELARSVYPDIVAGLWLEDELQ